MNLKKKRQDILIEMARNLYKGNLDYIYRDYTWFGVEDDERTTDLCIELKNGRKIAFEMRVGKQADNWVDEVIEKYRYSGIGFTWICTNGKKPLSQDEITRLNKNKIGWRIMSTERLIDASMIAMFNTVEPNFEEISIQDKTYNLDKKVNCLFESGNREILTIKELAIRKFNELCKYISPTGEKCYLTFNLVIEEKEIDVLTISVPFVIRTIFDYVEDINCETRSNSIVFKSKFKSIILKRNGKIKVNFNSKRFFKDGVVLEQYELMRKNIYKLSGIVNYKIKKVAEEYRNKIFKIYEY